jgi:hypothetical protein
VHETALAGCDTASRSNAGWNLHYGLGYTWKRSLLLWIDWLSNIDLPLLSAP